MIHAVFLFSLKTVRGKVHIFLSGVQYVNNLGVSHSATVKQRFDKALT